MLKTYTMLMKPGIIFGNVATTAAGFALASRGHFDYWLFLATLAGLGLVIASAGVFNNYLDRFSDAKMVRTKDRPLAKGTISLVKALCFASILGIIGFICLAFGTNLLTVFVAFFGLAVYLILYAVFKYRTFYGTMIGSIAGGVPPLAGYCAVSNRFDAGAFFVFLILVVWQMPHFFAIAIYSFDDYAAASIPVLPVKKGMLHTKMHMVFYILAFIAAALCLSASGYTGMLYSWIAAILGLSWLGLCLSGFRTENNQIWARQMFVYSLFVIIGLCLAISVDVQ